MPAAHPPEFRRRALDLIAQGNPVGQTARDLGISGSCLRNWMNRDAIDSGRKPGLTTDEHKELVELRPGDSRPVPEMNRLESSVLDHLRHGRCRHLKLSSNFLDRIDEGRWRGSIVDDRAAFVDP